MVLCLNFHYLLKITVEECFMSKSKGYSRHNCGKIRSLCLTVMLGIAPCLWLIAVDLITLSIELLPTICTNTCKQRMKGRDNIEDNMWCNQTKWVWTLKNENLVFLFIVTFILKLYYVENLIKIEHPVPDIYRYFSGNWILILLLAIYLKIDIIASFDSFCRPLWEHFS